ncbi:MAG: class I SAM-dependent methyltransferase [Acidobacteriaceae bacterium]|nr:class I SAM-dependent methyltransferase [Acidobacteriaceae bacterium]
MQTERKEHWENVYRAKASTEVSWYREHLDVSLGWIRRVAASRRAAILDIGGGASTLADDLISAGFDDVTVLDVAEPALDAAQQRLGADAGKVHWIEADFLHAPLEPQCYDICHDRGVFHFLTSGDERAAYFDQVNRILRPEGTLIVTTFAPDGPSKCSGLEIAQYDEDAMLDVLGGRFTLSACERHNHRTPQGNLQQMMTFVMRHSMNE